MTRTPPISPETEEFELERARAEARWIQDHAGIIARLERVGHAIELSTFPYRTAGGGSHGTAGTDSERLWNTVMWCGRCDRRYARTIAFRRLKDGSPCR